MKVYEAKVGKVGDHSSVPFGIDQSHKKNKCSNRTYSESDLKGKLHFRNNLAQYGSKQNNFLKRQCQSWI